MKRFFYIGFALLAAVSCGGSTGADTSAEEEQEFFPLGFDTRAYILESGIVKNGDTFSGLMTRLGMTYGDACALADSCKGRFDLRKLRSGNAYDAYYSGDSLSRKLEYLVYTKDKINLAVFKCADSLRVWNYSKPVRVERKLTDVTIKSSLWNDMLDAGASPLLIVELSDIFAWTVDFFGLQEGDRFRTIYSQSLVDDEIISVDAVNFAVYSRAEANEFAIMLDQGDNGNRYWNEKGESLRKAFLKAPLKFSRVSSGFTYRRLHPVHHVYRPHTGVDYAAPAGTPVHALGDGTVISAGWGGGGGNTIKIRHNSVYTTGYLHLRSFAKGIKAGVRVRQGDVIGYVGSTGSSTGPHLDFRVWKNGTPINPLTLKSPSAEPIREENRSALDSLFNMYKDEVGM